MSKTVSIIVPVYNVAHYVENCLRSILSQTYESIEVVFVDDCGTDDSMSIIHEYMDVHDTDFRIRYCRHEHNKGLSAARNTGLRVATGEYVYFLDSDDEISCDCIELLFEAIKDCDFAIGDYSDSLNENASPLLLPKGIVKGEDVLGSYSKGKWYVMAWNKLCRRQFLIDNDLFFEEGVNHEDVIWSFKLACKAKSMAVVDKVTYKYSIRESSIMTGMSIDKDVQTYLKTFNVIKEYIVANNLCCGKEQYTIVEGKKNGVMYSLLEKNEYALFWKCYPQFWALNYIPPFMALKKQVITLPYFVRDVHYAFPAFIGAIYKILFYLLFYKIRGKKIEGKIWK